MRIDVTADIAFPRERVFATYRDHLVDLVPYLTNVRAITITSRVDEGEIVKFVNRWKGGGEIPGAVRKVLSEELLEWDDLATWNAKDFTTLWQTIVPAFKDAVDARGTNTFTESRPGFTTLKIAGELKVDASKVKGVPRLLAGPVGSAVESFLVGAIKPNLVAVAKGVEKFLTAKGG
ncbi:MAG: hypothetical protein JNM17_41050 [Archangium sp.]|nr:hypothetical protein [Archangium sp.]